MKEKIKKYIGEMMTIVGVGVLTYNVFNFSYKGGYGGEYTEGDFPSLVTRNIGGYEFNYVAYYYTNDTILLITIGAMLIVSGILIIRDKNYERKN